MMKILFAILLLIYLPALPVAAGKPLYEHNILIVHSYHKQMQWVEEVQSGIEKTLTSSLGNTVDMKIEYMDSKRYVGEDYYAMLANLYRYKYANNQPDCIIVCDDNAFNLILSLRKEVFPGVPIVFCGVNYYDERRFRNLENVTGVIEAYDLNGTLDIIKRLMPERRRLFIINDDTTTGRANKERLEEIAYYYLADFDFIYSGTQSIDTLRMAVGNLSAETAILLMSYNRDAEETSLRYRDTVAVIRNSSSSPVFGVWSFYLGKGIVGGSLVNGSAQGEKAADLCLQILMGTPVSKLPVIRTSPNMPMFDYHELQRFSISTDLLPEESVVINLPDSIWHRYKWSIILVITLVVVQFFVIAMLVHNVRKRKKSEQRLESNQQNLATTLAAIGEAVISIDTDGNIVRANPAASSLFHTSLAQMKGRNLKKILLELDKKAGKQLADIIELCFSSGGIIPLPENTVFKVPDETARLLSGNCSAIRDSEGTVTGAVLICRDITERESMRDRLVQSQKLEAIGQLAGGVAHDFNNLLTGISGFAELLSIQLENEQQRQNVLKIISAADRAKSLTRQLLSFARKGKIVSSQIDCHTAIRSTAALLERSIDKRIRIVTRLEATHSTILGDPVQLDNILLNLGINGADAMEGQGTLTFATFNETITETEPCDFGESLQPGRYIRIAVRDTGCGISEELRHKIFEPFFTTKVLGKGTGLGLSAVFGAMKEHNGRIRLLSEVGAGTEFQLFFPLTAENGSVSETESLPLQGRGEKILVIDDEPLILSSAQALLEELGYRVLLAEGGLNGINCFRENLNEIDLVLLDMIMPDLDGAGCFAALKSIKKDVRVIISSGYAKTAKIKETEQQGAAAFLQKPYSVYEVSRTVRQVLDDAVN